jgi:hypothetical protein
MAGSNTQVAAIEKNNSHTPRAGARDEGFDPTTSICFGKDNVRFILNTESASKVLLLK